MQKALKTSLALFLFAAASCGEAKHPDSNTVATNTSDTSSIYPPESFTLFEGKKQNGTAAMGATNLAYATFADKAKYPWFVSLMIALDSTQTDVNGLPEPTEKQIAVQLSDSLLAGLRQVTTAHCVLRIFHEGYRDIYIYVDNAAAARKYLEEEEKKTHVRPMAYEVAIDSTWQTVQQFLK